MAESQAESALWIDLQLQDAIMRHEFSALERRVIDAVMRYTFAAGKSKAEINAEDIRLMIEGSNRVRNDRVEDVIIKLTTQHVLTRQPWNKGQLIGIQKDSSLWLEGKVDTLSITTLSSLLEINKTNPVRVMDKVSTSSVAKGLSGANGTPGALVDYSQEKSGFTHGITTWRTERSWAIKLLKKALALTNDPLQAKQLICDYIDENEWMRKNVQRQFAYMFSRFDQWFSQIPRKPRDIAEQERSFGRQYRYDVKLKHWTLRGQTGG